MKLMLLDWRQQAWAQPVESLQVKPTNMASYSVPHAARNPDIIQDCKLAIEDPDAMILDRPPKGAVRFLTEPGSLDTSWDGITSSTYQGVATVTLITPRSPYTVEGARWHLLSKIFSSAENDFKADLEAELLTQESLDEDKGYRSFSWQFLR